MVRRDLTHATGPTSRDLVARLQRLSFGELPADCGAADQPGRIIRDEWDDWSSLPTTPDQRAIEAYLEGCELTGKRILHVGIGNSGLAQLFAAKAGDIVGMTISPQEHARAEALGIGNYRTVLHNKYLGADPRIPGRFHFIVDNNPTTYACCLTHFAAMLTSYAQALTPDGQLLTERRGLGWLHSPATAHPRWSFGFADWEKVGRAAGLEASRRAGVYVLSHRRPPLPGAAFWFERARQVLGEAKGRLRHRGD